MIGYKVLKRNKKSALAKGGATVQYVENEWVTAPLLYADRGYHLLAFKTLRDAQRFRDTQKSYRYDSWGIWKAELVGVVDDVPCYSHPDFVLMKLKRGWRYPRLTWPLGTIMVRKIKLLWEVLEC